MPDAQLLAESHRVRQVQTSLLTQAALGDAFSKHLRAADLDASFPSYLRASLAILAAGRKNAADLATLYYGQAREAAGYGPLVDALPVPPMDVKAATTSLLVTGPVAVKKQLSTGAGIEAAMAAARRQTLNYGKRATLNGARATIIGAVQSDKAALGWARVSDGQPCAFCAMLVSRGPVYKNETVDFKAHDGCGCGIRPFFEGEADNGWSPDALALRDAFKGAGDIATIRARYAAALENTESAIFQAYSEKVGSQIALPVIRAARASAKEAFEAAQVAKRAAEAAARAAVTSAEKEAAEKAAKEAAKQAALVKKWKGKPAPAKPTPPAPPATVGETAFDGWLAACKQRFADFAAKTGNPKNDLTKSLNWSYFQRVVKEHDKSALDYLKANSYIDDALYKDALAAMKAAEQPVPGAAEAYKSALRSYKNRRTRYDRYLREWREVNGIKGGVLKGMDADNVLRHENDADGVKWANDHLTVARGEARQAIERYTGSSYDAWNGALRKHADPKTPPPGWEDSTRKAESAFSPVPQDVIVNRGTTWMEFALDEGGRRSHSIPPPPPQELIGTVHVQHGYMSTSVGRTAAFSSNPVQMKILVPEGHRATWAMPYSRFNHERELLLERSTRFFIHDVYQQNGKWIVEAEVLPMDAEVSDFVGAATAPSARKFTG